MLCLLIPIFKGKGDPLTPNSCHKGIQLLECTFKQHKVLDGYLREVVNISKRQYGFILGRGTVDVVFILSRLEKFRAKNKLFFVFVDLEKAFDH